MIVSILPVEWTHIYSYNNVLTLTQLRADSSLFLYISFNGNDDIKWQISSNERVI